MAICCGVSAWMMESMFAGLWMPPGFEENLFKQEGPRRGEAF
jgi:hypothetical protein